jgi:hypothetical protein
MPVASQEKDQKIARLKSQIDELKRRTEHERVEFERQMRDDVRDRSVAFA